VTADVPWVAAPDGLVIAVRVTPKGRRDAIDGVRRDADGQSWLAVRVSVPPEDGAATAAVAKLIARAFAVRPRDVGLVNGASSRLKRFHIVGNTYDLARKAKAILGEAE
jgi:uncharacterized protein